MEDNKLNEILEGVIASLTEEQKEQAKACKDVDELIALLGKLGVELPDELLDGVGGGLNLGSFFNPPMVTPPFGKLFRSAAGSTGTDAIHMDQKGKSSAEAIHMDVSIEPEKMEKSLFV